MRGWPVDRYSVFSVAKLPSGQCSKKSCPIELLELTGQMNAQYQNLIERLTWIENRHSTLSESNILKNTSCGLIVTGQNWRGKEVVDVQKEVLTFFGFDVKDELCWNWQYTMNAKDETKESYKKSGKKFKDTFDLD